MRCLYPRTVGFQDDGRTIAWSFKKTSKEFPTFQLPCGKCLECRLEYGRQAAVRCVHESMIHEKNCFITLTYSDENLKSPKLQYSDFQEFIKKLRDQRFRDLLKTNGLTRKQWSQLSKEERSNLYDPIAIGVFVTGEYGDLTKRPHWHALLFNYRPDDLVHIRNNDRGDRIYKSETLDKLWGHNNYELRPNEIGDVTFESAGYCARYAAKKLVHGNDQDHDYQPIHKRSSKHAIGKRWLEKYWKDIFGHGICWVHNSQGVPQKVPIPRYYEKWMLKNHPEEYLKYVSEIKCKAISNAEAKAEEERQKTLAINWNRSGDKGLEITAAQTKEIIIKDRFNRLQQARKGE